MKTAGARGQVLARKLMQKQAVTGASPSPTSQAKKQEEGRGHADACTSANLPPPITMNLDHQGPPVTYSKVASRPPQRVTTTPDDLEMCDVQIKVAAHKWEKEATWATLNQIRQQEWDEQAAWRKEKERMSSEELASARLDVSWQKRGLSGRKSIIASEGPPWSLSQSHHRPLGMVWIWVVQKGQVQKSHMGWGSMECQPHGPPATGHEDGLLMGPC